MATTSSPAGRRKVFGLRLRFMALLLAMSILPAAVITVISYQNSRTAMVTQANSVNLEYISSVGRKIDQYLSDKLAEVQSLADEGSFTAASQAVGDGIAAIYMLSPEGDILESFGVEASGSVAGEPWFEKVRSGGVYWGDFEMNKALGRPTMKIAAAPRATLSEGAMFGPVLAEIDIAPVQAILDEAASFLRANGKTGFAFLVNRQGLLLGHPQKERVLRDRLGQIGGRDLARIAEDMTAGKKGAGVYTLDGVRQVVVYTPLQGLGDYKGNGWSIGLSVPEREVYGLVMRLRNLSILVILVIALISCAVSVLVSGGIAKPLVALRSAAGSLSRGDLTVEVPSVRTGDEVETLAEAFGVMLSGLRGLVRGVKSSAAEVASTSEALSTGAEESARTARQIAETIQQVATGAQEQSASAVRGRESLDRLIEAIEQVARGAEEQVRRLHEAVTVVEGMQRSLEESGTLVDALGSKGHKAAESAMKGESSLRGVLASIDRIDRSSRDVAAGIAQLSSHFKEIGRIVEVISGIADQTNLLALNAAIEAARAGEHGRGFAVVADEVRKLAEQSAREAKAIAELVEKTRQATDGAVTAMNAGSADIESGVKIAREAEKALAEILESATETTSYIERLARMFAELKESGLKVGRAVADVVRIAEETAVSAEKMTLDSKEVKKTIDDLAALSEESAAASEEVSASSEQMAATIQRMSESSRRLAELAERLRESVEKFTV